MCKLRHFYSLSLPFKMSIKMAYIKHFKVPPNGAARFLIVSSLRFMPFFKWQGKNLSCNVLVFTQNPIQNGSLAKFKIWLKFRPGTF